MDIGINGDDRQSIAENTSDAATADLATRRLNLHETTVWMLRSLLEG